MVVEAVVLVDVIIVNSILAVEDISFNNSNSRCMLTPTTVILNNNQCIKTITVGAVVEEVEAVAVKVPRVMNGGINNSYIKFASRVIDNCFFCYVCNLIN